MHNGRSLNSAHEDSEVHNGLPGTINLCTFVGRPKPLTRLQAGDALSGSLDDSQKVVAEGVAQVSGQVLDGSLAGNVGLDEESEHGEHRQSSVLDLLNLQQSELVGVVGKAEGVECTSWVKSVQVLESKKSNIFSLYAKRHILARMSSMSRDRRE